MNGPHISIKAEPLFEIGGFHITNSYITSLLAMGIFFLIAVFYYNSLHSRHKNIFFYGTHFVVKTFYSFFQTIMGEHMTLFFPLLGAFFFYILIQNWFGLLPGVSSILITIWENGEKHVVPLLRANTADLNTTLALALLSVSLIQYYGIKFLGFKEYTSKFINLKNPLFFIIGILELVSEFSRVISFSFRLYGNIFAGEVLLTIIAMLVPILASFPFLVLEVFVGFIQAVVFSSLTAVFMKMAITKDH